MQAEEEAEEILPLQVTHHAEEDLDGTAIMQERLEPQTLEEAEVEEAPQPATRAAEGQEVLES